MFVPFLIFGVQITLLFFIPAYLPPQVNFFSFFLFLSHSLPSLRSSNPSSVVRAPPSVVLRFASVRYCRPLSQDRSEFPFLSSNVVRVFSVSCLGFLFKSYFVLLLLTSVLTSIWCYWPYCCAFHPVLLCALLLSQSSLLVRNFKSVFLTFSEIFVLQIRNTI